jgi:hypothetical protein
MPKKTGSLVVVGTGIRVLGQLTVETIAWIKLADRVFYLVADQVAETAVRLLNPNRAESLAGFYVPGEPRRPGYHKMAEAIAESVRSGNLTCAAFYGHPGVCVYPAREAVRLVRESGLEATVLPAISTEDCLFADLGVEPGEHGCQSYEATYFLRRNLKIEPTAGLVLWMVGSVGDPTQPVTEYDRSAVRLLAEKLGSIYSASHEVTLYRASLFPGAKPWTLDLRIQDLAAAEIPPMTTLYVKPMREPKLETATAKKVLPEERRASSAPPKMRKTSKRKKSGPHRS